MYINNNIYVYILKTKHLLLHELISVSSKKRFEGKRNITLEIINLLVLIYILTLKTNKADIYIYIYISGP